MAARFIVPALAVAGRAVAQCSVSGTTTIGSAADATALSSCSTFTGSIALATGTAGQIALNGITRIEGSLIADNVTQVTAISAGSLTTIDDTFGLNGLTILTGLTFPLLTTVDTIDWVALPALQGLSFTSGVQMASTLSIQNTDLNTLDGINLEVVDTVIIANNDFLNDITMHLGNITTSLTITSNGDNVTASFPNLEWAYNMTFYDVATVNFPSLASLNGSLGLYENTATSISAPNLTTVGGSLTIDSNPELVTLSFPELTKVTGAFQIVNNTDLLIVSFPSLQSVGGALDFEGAFTNVTLADLENVSGAFKLSSSADISADCSTFSAEAGATKTIKGKYTCTSHNSTSSSGTATTSSTSSATSKGAANAVVITGATGLLGVVAAIFGML